MKTGICPVCNGTKRQLVSADQQKYKHVYSGYDKETDTLPCSNCGAQYMYGSPRGEVKLNKDEVPCTHSYSSKSVGRCLTQYTCQHCGDSYQIDSGD
jgi:uncharacterized protein YbaR (Trm112 family)